MFPPTNGRSRQVAVWICRNTAFDRLYFYGDDRPLHVSVGPENSRQIVVMRLHASGRLMPKVVTLETLAKGDRL